VSHFFTYLHRGQLLVAERPCTDPERRAWIGIYPLNPTDPTTQQLLLREGISVLPGTAERFYRIHTFELPRNLENTYFPEEVKRSPQYYFAIGDDDLVDRLRQLEILPTDFNVPWRSDYPL